ncbi:MAG: class I SAM-dependent rRNA methyltransferase [Candidatus Dojkabacteria bacterium]
MEYKTIKLKFGKERALIDGNRWIFSGAIDSWPEDLSNGELVQVISANNSPVGFGYANPRNSIAVRLLSFGTNNPIEELNRSILNAFNLRAKLFLPTLNNQDSQINAFRLINSEADGVPGLIADFYKNIIVIQSGTKGVDKLKDKITQFIVQNWQEVFKGVSIDCVYEKSGSQSRAVEQLESTNGILWQSDNFNSEMLNCEITEYGTKFIVPIETGHKTGAYLDQREMRNFVSKIAQAKNVLNCFSYTGGFSLKALAGGAFHVTSVDMSETALNLISPQIELNNLEKERNVNVKSDVLEYLKNNDLDKFDLIILDPPAFAKSRKDVEPAVRMYSRLNSEIFRKAKMGTILLTCSCSHFVDQRLFETTIFKAARRYGKRLKIISRFIQPPDFVIDPAHPGNEYLKCLVVEVTN